MFHIIMNNSRINKIAKKFSILIKKAEEEEEDYNEETTVWHITGLNSANNIMQNGFVPQPTNHGPGVSVSINKQSAAGLLKVVR